MDTRMHKQRIERLEGLVPGAAAPAGGGALTRLKRVWFVDGDSTATGTPDGNIETPFLTIAAAMAAVAASGDASTFFAIVLCPKSGSYVENVSVPANRFVSLTSYALTGTIIGNVAWTAGASGVLFLDGVTVTGNVMGTGTGGFVAFESNVNGNVDLSGMTGLSEVQLFGDVFAGNVLFLPSTAAVVNSCSIGSGSSTFTTGNAQLQNTTFNCTDINVAQGRVYGCNFGPNPCVFTSTGGTSMDGGTFIELERNGGSAIDVIVAGGYLAAPQPGANLGDASVTIAIDEGNLRTMPPATMTAPRTITLGTTNAHQGDTQKITRQDATANTLTVNNGGPGGHATSQFQVVMPASKSSSSLWRFDGTDWNVVDYGTQ